MATSRRLLRMRGVLDQRLGRVRCAVEAVYHRHNVSAILRTCDAFGLHHVHLVQGRFTPSQGASRGAERWLDLQEHPGPEEALAAIQAAGCRIFVADLGDDAITPEQIPVDRPVCLWMGAELTGVSEAARAAADGVVTIPMHGFAQSLNVSVAAALALRPMAERARALGDEALLDPELRESIWEHWLEREETLRHGIRVRSELQLD